MQQCIPLGNKFSWVWLLLSVDAVVFPFKTACIILLSVIKSKPLRVVIADDDEDDREFFIDAVKVVAPNIKVDEVENGCSLIEKLEKAKELPDLIFLDLNMPVLHGLECLEKIRSHKKLKDIPVIIYSTSMYKGDIDSTYKAGADCYVGKPTTMSDMRKILNTLLQKNWGFHSQPDLSDFVLYPASIS